MIYLMSIHLNCCRYIHIIHDTTDSLPLPCAWHRHSLALSVKPYQLCWLRVAPQEHHLAAAQGTSPQGIFTGLNLTKRIPVCWTDHVKGQTASRWCMGDISSRILLWEQDWRGKSQTGGHGRTATKKVKGTEGSYKLAQRWEQSSRNIN